MNVVDSSGWLEYFADGRNADFFAPAVAVMMQCEVVELDATIAISATILSDELKIPMTDSIILATAREHDAVLWTQDADFATMPDVKYTPSSYPSP